jgi:hypothetical protein
MSALGEYLSQEFPSIKFKSLELPPVEGAGMAENEDIRSLMKRMNAGYISLEELSAMFLRELAVGPIGDSTILIMKTLPALSSALLDTSIPEESDDSFMAGAVCFRRKDFPLVDVVTKLDFTAGVMDAERVFQQSRDLWIVDHKPFKFLKKPLVSAIMALETFMECAQIMYPGMTVRGVQDAKFLDIIEVGPQDQKTAEINCRLVESSAGQVVIDASLKETGLGAAKSSSDKAFPNYRAMVILGRGDSFALDMEGFPVKSEELDTIPLNNSEVLAWYSQRSDLQGRYRVMDVIEGSAHGAIRGQINYPQVRDFEAYPDAKYTYSPYLFEAFMHVMNFYGALRVPAENRSLIPFGIGSLTLARKCEPGERILIEARRNSEDEKGVSWNARGLDQTGAVVMFARNVSMRWFKL